MLPPIGRLWPDPGLLIGKVEPFGTVTPPSVGTRPLIGRLAPPPGLLIVAPKEDKGVTPGPVVSND